MNTIVIIGIIIFIIYILLHIKFLYKINPNYDILQSKNPNKENFEKIMNQKSPSVFTDISNSWNIKEINKKNINKYFKYYLCPLLIKSKYDIKHLNDKSKEHLIIEKNNRHLILQLKGKSKFYLFNPDQAKYLYIKKNKSEIDYWNQDLKKYPLLNKSQFIEIIIHENQMIYIPKQWLYAYESIKDGVIIDCNSESILSYFLR